MTGHRVLAGATRQQAARATRHLFDVRQYHLSDFTTDPEEGG